jgi:hypothetical protein
MIAFDYYDGVLEGVCRDLHGMREAYFTLIAWDEDVDGRIFATVEITEGTIQALADVLSRTHPFPEREVWTPRNRPGVPEDAAFIEALIAEARHRIRTEGMLLQAFQIESVPVRSRRVVESDLVRIDRMLASGKYDTIVGWFNP